MSVETRRAYVLAASLALFFCAAKARADIAPEPGSPEAIALAKEQAKTCKPGEAMAVCGVRAGVNWHPERCEKYENDPAYYLLKSLKYEEAYCKHLPGTSRPKPKAPPAEENNGLPLREAAGIAFSTALGGLMLWMIRRRKAAPR